MTDHGSEAGQTLRFEPDEAPPPALAAALGFQTVALILAGVVLTPLIVLRTAGLGDADSTWVVFAAMAISGLITVVQALRLGWFGSGHILFMGTSGAFIAVAIAAVQDGGLALLGTLVVASSLVQFLLAFRLAALRRLITPTVGGTVVMLIAVTVMPIAFAMVSRPPPMPDAPGSAAPVTAIVTLVAIVLLALFGSPRLRLWAPLLGIAVGCAVAAGLGILSTDRLAAAPWIGLPTGDWPGLDLGFGTGFWVLLVPFVLVTVIGAVETYGDAIAVQRVSWRRRRPIDFRVVQGAVYADGLGNLLSGLAGTLPNTTYSTSIAVIDITGVAARRVGIWGGSILFVLAFSPKLAAALLSVPDAVAGAYVVVLLTLLFVHGLKLVAESGLNYETGLVVGLSFWLGIGFQDQAIFHDHIPLWARAILDNGMTSGGLCAIVLTFLVGLRSRARGEVTAALDTAAIPKVHAYLQDFAARLGWDRPAVERLQLAAEEALIYLIGRGEAAGGAARRLRVAARAVDGVAELDIAAGPRDAPHIDDAMAGLRDDGAFVPDEAPLRLLRHLCRSVEHQQFRSGDHLTLRITSRSL
ncbi:MAG: solute carrier family 23 protein [Thalassobaculum sp.]|uniref:uracil-xanthine permease family protein n=1 Tax=Thalassobaculum sp. TaxID=2022740 RepID=UPI0032EDB1A9